MRVYEVRAEAAPDFDRKDFDAAWWLTPDALLARLDAGEASKGDLRAPVERLYFG